VQIKLKLQLYTAKSQYWLWVPYGWTIYDLGRTYVLSLQNHNLTYVTGLGVTPWHTDPWLADRCSLLLRWRKKTVKPASSWILTFTASFCCITSAPRSSPSLPANWSSSVFFAPTCLVPASSICCFVFSVLQKTFLRVKPSGSIQRYWGDMRKLFCF